MLKKVFFIILIILPAISVDVCRAQEVFTTASILYRNNDGKRQGKLNIYQDPRIDTLINRYILYNLKTGGLEGFRIQIYSSSNMNAREESGKVRADFMNRFPDIKSYASFERPGYYKIRVGDYRTKIEGTKDLLKVRRAFPDAYLVPDLINFPDLN